MGQQVGKGRREFVVGDLPVEILAPRLSCDAKPVEHEANQALERCVVQVVHQANGVASNKRERLGHLCSQARALPGAL